MTTTKTFKGNGADKILAEKIIEKVTETGRLPWQKPWDRRINAYSYASKKPFCLVNAFLLNHEGGYVSFNEIKKKGYQFKPEYEGVKGLAEPVFMRWLTEKEILDKDGKPQLNADGEPLTRDYWGTRFFSEWSIGFLQDKDGKPLVDGESKEPLYNYNAEQLIANYFNRHGVTLIRNANLNKAFFSPSDMTVNIPNDNRFKDSTLYYSTVFHEMVHSTGIELGRKMDGDKKSKDYSFEELVAEIGAWILRGLCGIETVQAEENSTAYLQGWCSTFKEKPYWIMMAYSMADKAVKCITEGLDSTKELPYTEVKALPAPKEEEVEVVTPTFLSAEQKRGFKKLHTSCKRKAKYREVLGNQWVEKHNNETYNVMTDSYVAILTKKNVDIFEKETQGREPSVAKLIKENVENYVNISVNNLDIKELRESAKYSPNGKNEKKCLYRISDSFVTARDMLTIIECLNYKHENVTVEVPKNGAMKPLYLKNESNEIGIVLPVRTYNPASAN